MGWLESLFRKGEVNKSSKLPKGFAYAVWSCLQDGESCNTCKSYDGMSWIPELFDMPDPPISSCQSKSGCRCETIWTDEIETGAKETAKIIRELGGKATSKQLDEIEKSKSKKDK